VVFVRNIGYKKYGLKEIWVKWNMG